MAHIDRLPPPPEKPVRSPPVFARGEKDVSIEGPAGVLEAAIRAPKAADRVLVLCHPHPLYGGSMHSPVPLALAKAVEEHEGLISLRFNFRGVGMSEGAYADGEGEVEDVRAVLAYASSQFGLPVALFGHSFGSWTGLRGAFGGPSFDVDKVLLIAPSTRFFDFPTDIRKGGELGILIGDEDEFCTVNEARELAQKLDARIKILPGQNHHFLKSRREMANEALRFLGEPAW